MNVLIVLNNDLFLFPFLRKYIKLIQKKSFDFKIVFWNREGNDYSNNEYYDNLIEFKYCMNSYTKKINKIKGYFLFSKFLNRVLKNNRFDKLFIFNTQTAFLCRHFLKKYQNKYIFDYRDESLEQYSFYKKRVERIIKDSFKTVMSSNGYCNLFRDDISNKIVLDHNNKYSSFMKREKKIYCKIRVSFWGIMRHNDYFEKLFMLQDNNPRFEFNIYGKGNINELIAFCKNKKIINVNYCGEYKETDIPTIAETTDILLNCYPNESIQKYSLTCKMYEAIFLGIPMIVQKDSYMEKYLIENNYPFYSLDLSRNDLFDSIEEWYSCNENINELIRQKFINKIVEDELVFENCMNDYLEV